MPTNLLDHTGRPLSSNGTGTPPLHADGVSLKHVHTFSGVVAGVAKTYSWRFDEALRDSTKNALSMRNDGFLTALLKERQLPSARSKWHVDPEDDTDPRQVQAAALVTDAIKRTPYFTKFRLQLLQAIWYGRYANQIVVDQVSVNRRPLWCVTKHRPVHGDKIQFRFDGTPGILINAGRMRQYTDQGAHVVPSDRGMVLLLDTPAWRERVVIHTHEQDDADYTEPWLAGQVHGVGLRHQVYWLWWLRQEVLSWLLDYLDRVGAGGLTIVWYDEGNAASEQRANEIAGDLRTGNVIVAPRMRGQDKQVYGVDRIEPSQVGSQVLTDLVEKFFEAKIERLFVGQSMSGGADHHDGLGGTGRAEFSMDTKFQLVAFDCENLDECLTNDLVMPLLRWNVPGADFRLRFVSDLSRPNPEKQLEAVNKAWSMGVDFDKAEVRGLTGMSDPKPGADTISQQQTEMQKVQALGGPGGLPGMGGPDGGAPPDGAPAGGPPGAGPEEGGGLPGGDETSPELQAWFRDAVESGKLFSPDGLEQLQQELQGAAGGKRRFALFGPRWRYEPEPPPQIVVNPPAVTVNVPEQPAPVVHVAAPQVTVQVPEQPAPVVTVTPPAVSVAAPAVTVPVNVEVPKAPDVTVNVPQQPAPVVTVAAPQVTVESPAVSVSVPEQPPPVVHVVVPEKPPMDVVVERHPDGTPKRYKQVPKREGE